ncbi:hypothetical protein IGB42_02458 [Andreprevotia sp. IGB-42]|uniref:hypothetical protein n=1 Tax=Andreprevotia sp. IGB-42 TaxID=2497473 RepID=UPI00157F3A89|nr:hypothetical protein [Andreprevotia sp. IGB-42]KAF0813062.1 hypothetical protein IGB42_02458 [Andreprevotia sp. IGB-42]
MLHALSPFGACLMYILLIGYLYVVVMYAAGTGDPAKAAVWIVLLGILPTWLLVWIKRRGQLARRRKLQEAQQDATARAVEAGAAAVGDNVAGEGVAGTDAGTGGR